MLTLTAPTLLAGLSLLALPVLAHLWRERARRELLFPTVRLLQEALAQDSQRRRWRDALLLLLRCVAVAVVVLAFAGPRWQSSRAGAGQQTPSVAVVLDGSASMRQLIDGTPAWRSIADVARRFAAPTTRWVLARSQPRPLAAPEAYEPGEERADLNAAVAHARAMLQDAPGPRRVVVVSDLQASNWDDLAADEIVNVAPAPPGNVGLRDPRATPRRATVGAPVRLTVTLRLNAAAARVAPLECRVQGNPIGQRSGTLDPGADASWSFDFTPPREGEVEVEFRTGPDGLDADNRAFLVLQVLPRQRIALLSGASELQAESTGYFLQRALSPNADSPLQTLRLNESALDERVTAAILCDHDEPPSTAVLDWVAAGGHLLVIPQRTEITGPRRLSATPLHAAWTPDLTDEAFLALSNVVVQRSAALPSADQTLLQFDDASPALTAQSLRRGRILRLAFSAAPTSSDLASHGIFVAYFQSLLRHLVRDDSAAAALTGQTVTLPVTGLDPGQSVIVRDPENRERPALVQAHHAGYAVRLDPLQRVGFHRVEQAGATLRTVAVNLDPRESELTQAVPRASPTASEAAASARVSAVDLSAALLLAAAAVLAVESCLVGALRR